MKYALRSAMMFAMSMAAITSFSSAQAATITLVNTDGPDAGIGPDPIVYNAIPNTTVTPGLGVGVDGYIFFCLEQNPATSGYRTPLAPYVHSNLPAYASVTHDNFAYMTTTNSQLTLNGTSYTLGALNNSGFTITIGSGVPDTLRIGFLLDFNASAFDPTVSSPNSAFTSVTATGWQYYAKGNHFLFVDITGLSAGAQIKLTGGSAAGIVFDHVVPEPATLALLGIGGLMMISRRRAQ